MDQESIVYGCIKDVTSLYSEAERRHANRKALLMLPTSDEWPYLSQEMFSIPQLEPGPDNYQTEVVHFGASYKAIEYEWKNWVEKFELLLSNMYWVSAVVHLETELSGVHTFTWLCEDDCHIPGMDASKIHCEWSREHALI
ncbi:hypothetical protein KO528_09360 [Saccharophagus degradans]|uniref:Uncharacterized protein n=1 Tax=Saccharophagus degradans TaxID=86304 RepID=A0AAW7X434_9GAMM|nr:hypothetical protein [Saccharophagus degradans]MBU2985557.1 hypothetical protein [Saccharophagus degradans]MDO6421303.1 hypothetical protein [Saccharophagus degradans]MDO6605786.1 hypothetical protein [Saccharophagus degradans]WGO96611.1 hypothetical protein QFX18_11190 [Saccharophagus degradans]